MAVLEWISHLVSHLVRLHQWYTIITGVHHPDEEQIPVHAAVGFRWLDVHKEIHLFMSYLFQVILEGIHSSYFDCFSWQTVPPVHNSRRKEVQSGITTTMRLLQLPTVTMGAATISKLEIKSPMEQSRCLTILNSSIKSARFLLSCSVHSLSFRSLSWYSKSFKSSNNLVKRCWTFSSNTVSFL